MTQSGRPKLARRCAPSARKINGRLDGASVEPMSAIFPRDPNEIARGISPSLSLLGPLRLPFLRPDLSLDACPRETECQLIAIHRPGLIVIRL